MGTSGSLKIVRTLASYFFVHRGDTENGQKQYFFRIFANYSNAKKRYPRVPYESWRQAGSENVVVFVAIIFWTRVLAAQSQRSLKFWVCHQNYAVSKKKTRLQFWVLTSDMNRIWKLPCETHVLFIWRLEIENCSRVFFFEHRNFAKIIHEIWPDFGQQ